MGLALFPGTVSARSKSLSINQLWVAKSSGPEIVQSFELGILESSPLISELLSGYSFVVSWIF